MIKNREQALYILGAILLLAILFWGFDTKPSTQKALEKSRALHTQEFDITSLMSEAKQGLKEEELGYIEALESQAKVANQDSIRIRLYKEISGFWFQMRNPLIAGVYAREVAELQQDAQSWAIAGTTFASALTNPDIEESDRILARDQAIAAFESAISLEPSAIEHRVNLALCYIETPDQAQPMKGVQMLAELATKYPESPLPPYHLARLALKTGQVERAEERVRQALRLDSTNAKIACLAIDIYTAAQKPEEARKLADVCAQTN